MKRCTTLLLLACLLAIPATSHADWTENRTRVWQDGDLISAMGYGASEPEALSRARKALAGAIEASLPELDPSLAAGAAVVGDRVVKGETTYVRLDFPARYGKACRSALAWLERGSDARSNQRSAEALEAFAQAVMQTPLDGDGLGALGLQLADEGFWGSAAMLLDAASNALQDPPVTLLRNRATVHIWMDDRDGARRAIERLRAHDDLDPELDTLEAMLHGMRPAPMRLQEIEAMPAHSRALDAELAVRFATWAMMDGATRRDLLVRDLRLGDVGDPAELGGLTFEGLRGVRTADGGLEVTDRDQQVWRFEAAELDGSRSCLELAAEADPPANLANSSRQIKLGGPFPIRSMAGASGLSDGWLRPLYATDQGGEDRIHMILHVRGGGRTFRIDLSGPLGHALVGRPGMLTCPQLVQMALDGLVLRQGDSP